MWGRSVHEVLEAIEGVVAFVPRLTNTTLIKLLLGRLSARQLPRKPKTYP